MPGMRLTSDTSISDKYFAPPHWDKDRLVLSIPAQESSLRDAHLNLSEWVRQIEEVMTNMNLEIPTY